MNCKFKKIFFTCFPIVFLASCATGYHAKRFTGGYSEILTNQDSFIVQFDGNRFTSSEKVHMYALKRAAELTIKNGYKYFTVLSQTDCSKKTTQTHTHNHLTAAKDTYRTLHRDALSAIASQSTYTEDVLRPAMSLSIRCFNEKPADLEIVDAEFFLENNP